MAPRARGMRKSLHTPEYLAFCELITQARKKAGLTQHALAKRLGRPQSVHGKYEGGERRLDVIEFMTVARAIGADPVVLLRALSKPRA